MIDSGVRGSIESTEVESVGRRGHDPALRVRNRSDRLPGKRVSARFPHPALRATFPPGEGFDEHGVLMIGQPLSQLR